MFCILRTQILSDFVRAWTQCVHVCCRRFGRRHGRSESSLSNSEKFEVGCEFLFERMRMQVPNAGWIVAFHISGKACPRICQLVRKLKGWVEAPDQGMQLGQLATIHERWFEHSIAEDGEDRARENVIRTNIRVDSFQVNVDFVVDA